MNPVKIVGWVGLLVAIIGAFADVPYEAAILVVLGLIAGSAIAGEDHVRVLVTALVLYSLSGALNAIPQIGVYLGTIFSNFGVLAAGASLTIIARNIWNRYKP